MPARLANSRGYSLIEILFAMGMISFSVFALANLNERLIRIQQQASVASTMSELRDQLIRTLESPNGWWITLRTPANNMDCVLEISYHCLPPNSTVASGGAHRKGGKMVEVRVLNRKVDKDSKFDNVGSTVIYNSSLPGNGFTPGGVACSNFPSPNCPIRWEIEWKPLCPNPIMMGQPVTCAGAPVRIVGKAIYNPGPNLPPGQMALVNTNNYSFDLIKSPDTISAQTFPFRLSAIKQFHSACVDCGPESKAACDSACHRFCATGCGSTTSQCLMNGGGLNYRAGSMVECELGAMQEAVCLCNL